MAKRVPFGQPHVWVAGLIVLALTAAGAAFRLIRLSEYAGVGLFHYELAQGVDALSVLQGEHALYFAENRGREGMIVYLVALAVSAMGRTVLAVRLPTALASVCAVIALFWLGWTLFGRDESGDAQEARATPWRGVLIAGVGAGLMVSSIGTVALGRLALRANLLPLLLTLCMGLLWSGWHLRRGQGAWGRVALAGLCAGLLAYTYTAARFVPVLFALFGLSFFLPPGLVSREAIRKKLRLILLFIGVAGLVAAPMLIFLSQHPEILVPTGHYKRAFTLENGPLGALIGLLENVAKYVAAFGFTHCGFVPGGELTDSYNAEFCLQPYEAVFFWMGAGIALWRWPREPRYRMLLLWAAVMLLPALLSLGPGTQSIVTTRLSGAVPAIYLLAAVGVWETVRFFGARSGQEAKSRYGLAVGCLIAGAVVLHGARSFHSFFRYIDLKIGTVATRERSWLFVSDWLQERRTGPETLYLVLAHRGNWPWFDFQYQGESPVGVVALLMTDFDDQVDRILTKHSHVENVKIVAWNDNDHSMGDDVEAFAFLFEKYGRFVESEQFADFRVLTFTDISRAEQWTFYDRLEPMDVRYDGGIALAGYTLGQGQEQLRGGQESAVTVAWPAADDDNAPAAGRLWGFLQWQIGPDTDVDFAYSLRLHGENEELVHQADNKIRELVTHTPTSTWEPGDENSRFDTLFYLDLPPELPAGRYTLRLVVYDFETRIPTVEIGVWQPELTLARVILE